MTKLTILGTGHALTTKCYNTCFTLENENGIFLVDGGGGNGILTQAEKAGIDLADVHHIFVTHAHTDHILGALWAIRSIAESDRPGDRYVYCHDVVKNLLTRYIDDLFAARLTNYMKKYFHFIEVKDGDTADILGMRLTFFDIYSVKAKQFGFRAELTCGRVLACLGDEPYNTKCEKYVRGADWLLSEAFCLYEDRDIFEPYEKCHSTAKDAGRLAKELGVKNLLLYHTEDTDLEHRKSRYTKEAAEEFDGNIYVPDDFDVIEL